MTWLIAFLGLVCAIEAFIIYRLAKKFHDATTALKPAYAYKWDYTKQRGWIDEI